VTMLSSPALWDEVVESKVSFPGSEGEDGRDEPSVVAASGPSSSSGITISPSRAGVECAPVVVGTGLCSLSNRYLMAVAIPAVFSGAETVDVAVRSPGELGGEPKVV